MACSCHAATLPRAALRETLALPCSRSVAERRQVPGPAVARGDVIIAGTVILDEICEIAQATGWQVSDRGLRWGLALRVGERAARNWRRGQPQ